MLGLSRIAKSAGVCGRAGSGGPSQRQRSGSTARWPEPARGRLCARVGVTNKGIERRAAEPARPMPVAAGPGGRGRRAEARTGPCHSHFTPSLHAAQPRTARPAPRCAQNRAALPAPLAAAERRRHASRPAVVVAATVRREVPEGRVARDRG